MRWIRQTASVAAVLLMILLVVVGGAYATGILAPPTAGMEDRGDWGNVSDNRIEIVTTYWIRNPNPVAIDTQRTELVYRLSLNDIPIATGGKSGFAIPKGKSTGTVRSFLLKERLPRWWVTHVRNSETSQLRVQTGVNVPIGPFTQSINTDYQSTVNTNISGAVASSLSNYEGQYPSDTPPVVVIEDTSVQWGTITQERTPLLITFTVRNPNPAPLPTPAFAGNLSMNGIEMARWQANEVEVRNAPEDGTIPPQSTEKITFVARINNKKIDEWFTSHVQQSEYTRIVFTGSLAITYRHQTYTIPEPAGLRCTAQMQTAIFVDGQSSSFAFDGCEPGAEPFAARLTDSQSTSSDRDTRDSQQESNNDSTPTTDSSTSPTAQIDASTTNGQAPLTITLDAAPSSDSDSDIIRYVWRFGDGSPPKQGRTVEHTYRTAGTYTVELTVIDAAGNRATATIIIDVTSRV